jgi:hypothetical protein
MKKIFATVFTLALALPLVAGSRQGIPPRSNASDYAVQKQAGTLTLGAVQLSNEQVKNSFSSDLDRGYIVVEVGVFPGEGGVDLRRDDFMLRAPGKSGTEILRPVNPETVAGVLQKKNKQAGSKDVELHPTVGVGYSTGSRDPYGNRYPGGWSTSAGVGVGVGNNSPYPPAASTDGDRRTMETELRDKILPEGQQTAPVAGYLYFPVAGKDKVSYQLEYKTTDGSKVVLTLPGKK